LKHAPFKGDADVAEQALWHYFDTPAPTSDAVQAAASEGAAINSVQALQPGRATTLEQTSALLDRALAMDSSSSFSQGRKAQLLQQAVAVVNDCVS
jgi:hypothetical protein